MVPIDNVYRTVLNILNKEQRGFITDREFNTLAKQAQTEIFESYFAGQNRLIISNRMSASDYADVIKNMEEKITFFENTATVSARTALGVSGSTINGYAYPSDFYRLSTVAVGGIIADEVEHGKLPYILRAPLTSPTDAQPIYTRHQGGVIVYPTSYTGAVTMTYVREPATPNWIGGVMNGQIVASPGTTGYQNFELHASEEPELVAKILAYSGVLVRDQEAAQAGILASQSIKQDES